MKTIDERIADAKARLEAAESETDKRFHQGEIDSLTALKQEGLFTQADLNRVDQQNKAKLDEWEQASGTNLEDFKKVMENIESSITVDPQEGGQGKPQEGDADPGLGRVLNEFSKRDQAIQQERDARLNFERELRSERITNRFNDTFRELGLNDKYLTPARQLLSYDDLVEKAMKGQEVTAEEIKQKAEGVKNLSPVWFESEPNPDYPGVPPSPEGGEAPRLTDEQRAEQAANVF